ncbi:phage tail tube protein [Lacticaseibacillus daqingensis]|uniref:phage tail tube protein n=1 Tax=Lacticaseibacillus daqingensis TaxID=2486014 RepID=UPI001CDD3E6A|nr:phage tail protein [Lacticaseibacillus daqingensis]
MRKKNAKRKHFIAPYTDDTAPEEDAWLPLAKDVETIEDDSDEDTDDYGDYAGDGTAQTILNGRKEVWNFSGYYNADDKAQVLLAGMRRETNDEKRKVWHKIVETDGSTVIGVAKAMEIKAGGGDATSYEDFEGHLDYVATPTVTVPDATAPVDDGTGSEQTGQ